MPIAASENCLPCQTTFDEFGDGAFSYAQKTGTVLQAYDLWDVDCAVATLDEIERLDPTAREQLGQKIANVIHEGGAL